MSCPVAARYPVALSVGCGMGDARIQPAWLISKRCPSGSRKKHLISPPQSYGGLRN